MLPMAVPLLQLIVLLELAPLLALKHHLLQLAVLLVLVPLLALEPQSLLLVPPLSTLDPTID